MTVIAVLGFGRIGSAVAGRLVAAGFSVSTYDPDRARRADAESLGVRWASSPADAVADTDCVFTALPGTAELQQLVRAPAPLLATLPPSAVWIDLGSTAFEASRECAAEAAAARIDYLDAALGGGPRAVNDGTVILYVGGDQRTVERIRPVLETFAGKIHHLGENGHGHLTKLLINVVWFGQLSLITEVLLLARRSGLSVQHVGSAFLGSAADSAFVRDYLPALLAGDYRPDFGLDRCLEELDGIERLAEAIGVPHGLTSATAELHRAALARFGPVNGEMLAAAWLEEQAGVRLSPGSGSAPSRVDGGRTAVESSD